MGIKILLNKINSEMFSYCLSLGPSSDEIKIDINKIDFLNNIISNIIIEEKLDVNISTIKLNSISKQDLMDLIKSLLLKGDSINLEIEYCSNVVQTPPNQTKISNLEEDLQKADKIVASDVPDEIFKYTYPIGFYLQGALYEEDFRGDRISSWQNLLDTLFFKFLLVNSDKAVKVLNKFISRGSTQFSFTIPGYNTPFYIRSIKNATQIRKYIIKLIGEFGYKSGDIQYKIKYKKRKKEPVIETTSDNEHQGFNSTNELEDPIHIDDKDEDNDYKQSIFHNKADFTITFGNPNDPIYKNTYPIGYKLNCQVYQHYRNRPIKSWQQLLESLCSVLSCEKFNTLIKLANSTSNRHRFIRYKIEDNDKNFRYVSNNFYVKKIKKASDIRACICVLLDDILDFKRSDLSIYINVKKQKKG
ncbi:MAG: hypothetical protein ACOCQD_00755 [archaeon]